MHLEVYDDVDSAINMFRYTVCIDDGSVACQHGVKYDPDPMLVTTISFSCIPKEVYIINVIEYNTLGDALRSTTKNAICMYVRREIRTLNSADISLVMDAMAVLWNTSDVDGQALYGQDYYSSSFMLNMHHFNAAWQDADHIHEGNGFLPQHIKMTNSFEKSIQSVDSSVVLPYWDFTIDNAAGLLVHETLLMTPNVFGSMTDPSDIEWGFTAKDDLIVDGAIPDGRWAGITANMNHLYDDLKVGYGYMRAPWNMNPSPQHQPGRVQ